jgi:hypothetical protein
MSKFEIVKQMVRSLKPGEWLTVPELDLVLDLPRCFIGFESAVCNPADRILEGIVGSAYEYSYQRDPIKREVTFRRLEKPIDSEDGRQTYVSPDRLKYYSFDGRYYIRNAVPYVRA